MRMKGWVAGAAAMAAATTGGIAGAAEGESGIYVAAGGTLSLLTDVKQAVSNAPAPGATLGIVNENGTGWGGYIALGHDFGGFRAEVEYGRTENDSDTFDIVSPFMATLPQAGETDISRYMANAYVDFGKADATLRPFIGAGAGAATVHASRFAGTAFAPNSPFEHYNDKATSFAWQAMAGAALKISPHLDLTAQYRWFDAGAPKLVTNAGQDFTSDVDGHHVDIGVRWSF